jgi:hypothetical protein
MYELTMSQEHMDAMPIQAKPQSPARAAKKAGRNPYEGSPLHVSGKLATHIRQSFGLNAQELKLRESPEVAAMGARATAQGNAIRFAPGEFRPDTHEGMAVLGHELSHVREQATGGVHAPGGEMFEHPAHEENSNRAGEAFAGGSLSAAAPVSLSGVSAEAAPVQGLMNPLSWLKQQKKNFSFTRAEGQEQSAALDIQKKMNKNIKQGDISMEDHLANTQYKAREFTGMRWRQAETQGKRIASLADAQRGKDGYKQGQGGIGRWVAKRMFHKKGGAQAIGDVYNQLRGNVDYNAQAAGIQEIINRRNNEQDMDAITFRSRTGEIQNAERDRVYSKFNLQKGADPMYWSRTAALMKHGGTQQDQNYNDEVATTMNSLYRVTRDQNGIVNGNEAGNAENYPKIKAIVKNVYQRLLDYDVEAVAKLPERQIIQKLPELSDIERPLMFMSDTMKKYVTNHETGKKLVDDLFTKAELDKITRKVQIIGYLQRSMEATIKLNHPELHAQMGIDPAEIETLQNTKENQGETLRKMLKK